MTTTFTLTFVDDAWQTFYDHLKTYTERGYAIELNGRLVTLIEIKGQLHDTDAVLAFHPWDDDENELDQIETMPLYDDGSPTVTSIHVE